MVKSRPFCIMLASVAFTLSGCRDDKSTQAADSSAALSTKSEPAAAGIATTGWDESESGPVVLVSASETVRQASVVLPNVTDVHDANADTPRVDSLKGNEFDLFDRSGNVGVATLQAVSAAPSEPCATWPVGSFRDPPSHSWRVGFSYRTARAIVLDSLASMRSADSTSITTELARLSSIVTANGDPAFQGLPFTVREAYRLNAASASVIIGDIVRTINEEANPREEHLLLIAEKQAGSSEYRVAFYSRSAGPEDEVRTSEILAAVRFVKTGRDAVVVLFGYEDGDRVALLERIAVGSWKVSWRSAYSGC